MNETALCQRFFSRLRRSCRGGLRSLKRSEVFPSAAREKKICGTQGTQQDVLKKIDDSLKSFIEYQQQAGRFFLEAEMERERKEGESEAKTRKEDQEFFVKLAEVLKNLSQVCTRA